MHILLLILKIIGIILLVLLGLILTLILLLLFVPFCYRAEGSYYDAKPYAMLRVRYLFPLLQVFVRYQQDEAEGKVKIFGVTIYDLFAPNDTADREDKKAEKVKPEQEDAVKSENKTEDDVTAETEISETKPVDVPAEENDLEESEEEKKSLIEKIKYFIVTIKEKILSFLQKIRDIREKGLQLKEKVSYYYTIWQQDYTQRAFQKAKSTLYKLWKSIRPKKGLVKLHFGTGDPGSTGQICGYFGMLYPFVGKYVMIEPDFENKIYEGDFYFKGRITLFAFLKVAWVVLFDKDIKRLRKILMNSDKEESYDK